MFVSGARMSYLVLAVLVTAPVVWKVLITGKAWRMDADAGLPRALAALPERWLPAVRVAHQRRLGRHLGQGLGASRQKLFFLPEAHTDFILAIIGEELGLVGVLASAAAFAVLFWRGMIAALRARDAFGSYLAYGITVLFALQALGNMGVVLGLLPTKGLALPFISYGGTSLVVSLFMAGVLGNISARAPEPRRSPVFPSRPPRRDSKNRHSPQGPQIMVDVSGKKRAAEKKPPPDQEPESAPGGESEPA